MRKYKLATVVAEVLVEGGVGDDPVEVGLAPHLLEDAPWGGGARWDPLVPM